MTPVILLYKIFDVHIRDENLHPKKHVKHQKKFSRHTISVDVCVLFDYITKENTELYMKHQ